MKQFIVSSGDFVVATGIYRMVDHPGRDHVGIRRHCANVPEAESKVPGSFGPLKIRSVAKPAGGRDGRQGSIQVGLRGDKCLSAKAAGAYNCGMRLAAHADHSNSLFAYCRVISTGVVTTTYGYDAFGARVIQTGTSTTTLYPFKWYSVASSHVGSTYRMWCLIMGSAVLLRKLSSPLSHRVLLSRHREDHPLDRCRVRINPIATISCTATNDARANTRCEHARGGRRGCASPRTPTR